MIRKTSLPSTFIVINEILQ